MATTVTVLLKEQLPVTMSEGYKKHDSNVYHISSSNLSRKKNCQFRVNRLESDADNALAFIANISKAWKPPFILLYSTMYADAQGRFVK